MRSYGQWCGVARALDVVGERWTLLVVRELLDGPQRYTDLRNRVPGIATDVLAVRLKELEEWGVVARRALPPPAASRVYELTELGRGLAPVVNSLASWGMKLLGERDEETFLPHWLALGLRGLVRPEVAADVHLVIDFDLGADGVARISVDSGSLRYVPSTADAADLTIRAGLGTLAGLADGTLDARDAISSGRLEMSGSPHAVRTCSRLFRQPTGHRREAMIDSTG